MLLNRAEAAEVMKSVIGAITKDVFDVDEVGLLIITASHRGGCPGEIKYELLDEDEREEWFIDNTPLCGNREHVGRGCTKNYCYCGGE